MKVCVIFVALLGSALAQAACDREFPLNLILPDGQLVRGAGKDSLIVRNVPVTITDLQADAGARRIVFVIDLSHSLSADARKAQLAGITRVLTNARKNDVFGLITARGPSLVTDFTDAPHLLPIVSAIDTAAKGDGPDLWDALMKAAQLFTKHTIGDSIVVFAGLTEPDQPSYFKAEKLIDQAQLRVFGITLSPLVEGTYYSSSDYFNPSTPYIRPGFGVANRAQIDAMVWQHAGYLSVFMTDTEQRSFKLDAKNKTEIERQAWQIYGAIVEMYRVKAIVKGTSKKAWEIDVVPEIRSEIKNLKLVYPRATPVCDGASGSH
jgi:hypothetical protein